MTGITRRSFILALAAMGAAPLFARNQGELAISKFDISDSLDFNAIAAVAESYEKATNSNIESLDEQLFFRNGKANMELFKAIVMRDFKEERVFIHRGWRLSYTEGQLFTILAKAI
jgi:hypothetical protein